ncbi:MAG: hypothetical protein JRG92_00085 [Deltaproteobacteria bacterium]|nr:hypothetical protein [Deltaproteobacteria bacterium]MBW2696573.1 hypothetical protein [Deltaproteobacteria bacterium]
MNAHSIPVLVMAGITLYVGVYHLFLYLRLRRNRWDLTFALTCCSTKPTCPCRPR